MQKRSGSPLGEAQDLAQSLRQLLDVAEGLNGVPVPPGLRWRVLAGGTAAAYAHISAILQLADTGNIWSGEVTLRPLLEGWIVSQYVVADDTDARAASYLVKSLNETRKCLRRIRALAEANPDQGWILSLAGVSSIDECDGRIAALSQGIDGIQRQYGAEKFATLERCARSLGVRTAWAYASVYALVLSGQIHVDYNVAFRFLQPPAPDALARTQEGMHRIMITAYMLYLDLLRMTSAHLGRPPAQSLVRFDGMLKKHLDS
jgi:hypothetical protein